MRGVRFEFKDTSNAAAASQDLDGLVDAFTGEKLDASLGLHECRSCHVYYHSASVQLLVAENSGRCVSCGGSQLVAVRSDIPKATDRAQRFTPTVINLQNFRSHVGQVVTLEGQVRSVKPSRNGQNFGAMFEDKPWCDGLKMLIFNSRIETIGGRAFIKGLAGRKIRVRGLLQRHPKFGYQIIVTERGMIEL